VKIKTDDLYHPFATETHELLVHLLAERSGKEVEKVLEKSEVDIYCSIDGLEVDLLGLIEKMAANYNNSVAKAAKRLVRVEFNVLSDKLQDIGNALDTAYEDVVNLRINPAADQGEYYVQQQ